MIVKQQGSRVYTCPIAGTRRRGVDAEEEMCIRDRYNTLYGKVAGLGTQNGQTRGSSFREHIDGTEKKAPYPDANEASGHIGHPGGAPLGGVAGDIV